MIRVLMVEGAMIVVFTALDLFFFFMMWEVTMIPMYFMIILWGGPGADTFVFDLVLDEHSNRIRDFDGREDRLNITDLFLELADNGAPGLADDIDARSDIVDMGRGGDVILTFDSGTEIIFEGAGTGAVTSVGDLVDDPMTQLLSVESFLFL